MIGNPPFLGGSKKRRELGDVYFEALDTVFAGRVPGGADLVCYWLDKGRMQIQYAGAGAVGLVTTNSIRGGANQLVLRGICEVTKIFSAYSDEGWVNDGAAVRVSLVCFGAVSDAVLDGISVSTIHADLTAGDGLNLTKALVLESNTNASFQGSQKIGSFDISGELARSWLRLPNPNGRSNGEVLKPSWNGLDVARRPRDGWIIDFGIRMSDQDASLYETPFEYAARIVKPERELNKREAYKKYWWRHGEPRVAMRSALTALPRYFVLSAVTKHIYWRWLGSAVLPDKALIVVSRADDATFGILHSRFHELWSLRMCTWLGVGNDPRYTPTTCFETFPFPAGLTPADTAHQQTETIDGGAVIPAGLSAAAAPVSVSNVPPAQSILAQAAINNIANGADLRAHAEAIARAAKRLNDLREAWLNPPEWTERVPEVIPLGMATSPYPDRILPKPGHEKDLADRTLTKLYNQRPAWLAAAHQKLDAAVAAAYGWADYTADMPDEEILKRLLALNLARAAVQNAIK